MGSDFSSFISDVVDVVMTPFREVMKAITNTISDSAEAQIGVITDVVHKTGVDDLASDVIGGVTGIVGGAIERGGDIIDRGSDSLFGTLDVMKYLPIGLLAIGGVFLISNGKQILGIGERQINRRS